MVWKSIYKLIYICVVLLRMFQMERAKSQCKRIRFFNCKIRHLNQII